MKITVLKAKNAHDQGTDMEMFVSTLEAGIRKVMESVAKQKAPTSAVEEREQLVAAYLHAHPAETRANAVAAVYSAQSGLYERCRAEETVNSHGRTLREMYDNVTVVGKAQSSVDDEIARRVDELVAKTAGATRSQAMAFVFQNDPELYERWRRESYA